ncbi:amidohydrolase family protein [soil metagenome]
MSLNRRHFFRTAGTAGLGIAAMNLVSDALAFDLAQKAPATQPSSRNVILTNASLIDSVRPEPSLKATVVVKDGRIIRVGTVGPTQTERQDSSVIDLGGTWLLPGLCDAHTHLISPLQEPPGETVIDRYLRLGKGAIDAFQLGVTSARVLGAPDFCDVAWRKAFARGSFLGPRLFVAGHSIVPTAGHGRGYGYGQNVVADGPIEVRKAVREQIQADVDLIKIVLTGGVFGLRWDNLDNNDFLQDEVDALFQTSHQRGYRVAAHAGNAEAVKMAARAGALSVEHGYVLDEEAIQLMVERKTIYVPTLCVTFLTDEAAVSPYEKEWTRRWPMPANLSERANQRRQVHLQAFTAALKAGVRIASGADHSPLAETAFLEIELLVRCGMTPMQAIIAATRTSTEAATAGKDLGTLEVGKLADLIVVGADPLGSIHNLRKTVMVFKEGKLAIDKR